MSFPVPGTNYTLNTYDYINGMTIDGDSPGSSIITAYLAPPGKGSGPNGAQIWQTQPSIDGCYMLRNPDTSLVLELQDHGSITGEVMAGPKDYDRLQRQCWQIELDQYDPGVYM
jgi:hypothetical protein